MFGMQITVGGVIEGQIWSNGNVTSANGERLIGLWCLSPICQSFVGKPQKSMMQLRGQLYPEAKAIYRLQMAFAKWFS